MTGQRLKTATPCGTGHSDAADYTPIAFDKAVSVPLAGFCTMHGVGIEPPRLRTRTSLHPAGRTSTH